MRRLAWMICAALAALAGTQCGYPDFMFGTTSAGGSAGSGGGETTTTSSVSSTSGTGGGGPKTCRLLHDAEDCGATERCTIIDPDDTGATGCVPLSKAPLPKYARCDNDSGCPRGTWCDQRTYVCMPFCAGAAACAPGYCVAARNAADLTIPGASVCTAHCDPVAATPCALNATCTYDANVGDFDCFLSFNKADGAACKALNDCGKGLMCVGSFCSKWCHPAGSLSDPACLNGCGMFSDIAPMYGGDIYGYCY